MYVQSLNTYLEIDLFGAKASHLSAMKYRGIPVPDGIAISAAAYHDFSVNKYLPREFILEIQTALHAIGAQQYIVRSSAVGEDSQGFSFAGQLDSFVSGHTIEEIVRNINRCWASGEKSTVAAYQSHTGNTLRGVGVVIQEFIEPDFAGVIFTRSHLREGNMLVEYVAGRGDQLVSGNVTPMSMHCSLHTVPAVDPGGPDLRKGVSIARDIEMMYGAPTDIEWVMKQNAFFVVQARPITTPVKEKTIYWSNTNVTENYPDAISPLLYSIARDSYYHYFKNLSTLFGLPGITIRRLEYAYSNIIGIFGCRMYYNMSSIHEIISASPFADMLLKSFNNFVGYSSDQNSAPPALGISAKIRFIKEFLTLNAGLRKNVAAFESLVDDFSNNCRTAVVYEDHMKRFHEFIEIRMHSWYRASVADFFAMAYYGLLGKFCGRYYRADSSGIQNKLVQAIPGLISSKPVMEMYAIITQIKNDRPVYEQFTSLSALDFYRWIQRNDSAQSVLNSIQRYLDHWGYRCSGELMLTEPTYIEQPEKFISLLQQYEKLPDQDPGSLIRNKQREATAAKYAMIRTIWKSHWWFPPAAIFNMVVFLFILQQSSLGISSRERVRLRQALAYFRFKQTIQKIESVFIKKGLLKNIGDIVYLSYREIAENLSASDMLYGNLAARIDLSKKEYAENKQHPFPNNFSTERGCYLRHDAIAATMTEYSHNGVLKGLCACGGYVRGRVKVLSTVLEAGKLEQGDILVTQQTDPGWVVVFPLISGLIVERGGMLSHGAIVSREFGIPAVVGVDSASTVLKDGDIVSLYADNGEIRLHEE